jgi:hypothetical protein
MGLDPVLRPTFPGHRSCAVRTAEEPAVDLGAVADDLASAVLAHRRHAMDGALEAVEHGTNHPMTAGSADQRGATR